MKRSHFLILWIAQLLTPVFPLAAAEPETLRVMTFNLWIGGEAGKQPLEQTAQVIRAAKADLVGLQETDGRAAPGEARPDRARQLAKLLGWNCFLQGGGTAVITRHEIVGNTPAKWGVEIQLASGRKVWLFNAHFPAAPYQPYQLLSIPYYDAPFLKTADEAVEAARAARGAPARRMLEEIKSLTARDGPVFVTGDFNEPSHRDWTSAAAAKGLCPIAVEWPTTKEVEDLGFRDGWRAAHPNPVAAPGMTWTPITAPDDPKDRHDRIDFVFARGQRVTVKSAQLIGEAEKSADVVVTPYPSDHRAVVVAVEITP